MSEGRLPATKYVVDPMAKFPRRWRDHIGNIRVMGEPIEGYLMVRRPGAMPFCLPVSTILNATKDPTHGPFEVIKKEHPDV